MSSSAILRALHRAPVAALRRFISVNTIPMPSLSPTMTAGTISSWKYKAGDELKPGDILCDIETDKASVGFEIQDDGILARIIAEPGMEMPCGAPIAMTVEGLADYQEFLKDPSKYASVAATPAKKAAATTDVVVAAAAAPVAVSEKAAVAKIGAAQRLSPAARHMVHSRSLDVSALVGTSRGGLISKSDVVRAVSAGQVAAAHTAPAPTTHVAPPAAAVAALLPSGVQWEDPSAALPVNADYKDIPNSNIRKVIARRLTESKATVPHFYASIECEIDSLLAIRKTLKKDLDVNVSVNDIVIKSAGLALRDVSAANNKWNRARECVDAVAAVDISVAVATPTGLITPIVTNSDQRGLGDINDAVRDLAARARDGKLKPEEYQGGSFSISNLGMFGISSFSAVINPPQACILAVGAGVARVLPPAAGAARPRVATTVTVQLSADRRVLDEATAAQFLQVLGSYLSKPLSTIM